MMIRKEGKWGKEVMEPERQVQVFRVQEVLQKA